MKVPNSFIKNIALQLPDDYQFENSPSEISNSNKNCFIGRKELKEKFLKFLNTQSKKGIFLVTGYRGMGKTSFVNRVIGDYQHEINKENERNKENKKDKGEITVCPIHLTIAQNNPKEFDVLKQIVISTYDNYKKWSAKKGVLNSKKLLKEKIKELKLILFSFVWFALVLSLLIPFSYRFAEVVHKDINAHLSILRIYVYALLLLILILLIFLLYKLFQKKDQLNQIEKDPVNSRIHWLVDRTFSNISEEMDNTNGYEIEFKGIKAIIENKRSKKGKTFPLASAKDMEYELKEFLKIAREENGLNFIYVFDELDKIELNEEHTNIYQDLDSFEVLKKDTNPHSLLRNRKQAVMSIVTGLKNFFTTAHAQFIFVAGREMFDASLADISDKQSPLSSIFTYIFNIESLLKEEEGFDGEKNTSSLTIAIEEFLKYQLSSEYERKGESLIPHPTQPEKKISLKFISFFDYIKFRYSHGLAAGQYEKIYFILQAFITYLAYRSNGSPKKLIRAFQEFISANKTFNIDLCIVAGQSENSKKYSLYFNYYNQYRIGFINYIYRPFLIQNGRSFKLFSDNAIISIPYLFDHLIKFHPFAFSRSHLELVPELLSTNKTPAIKQDLDQIINYLGHTHLRDTDVELFEYKFYSKSYNEIVFLSRVFEEEGAAFNFTLDESYSIKVLLNDKIKELRSIFSRFYKDSDKLTEQIFSIAYHNSNLGDLHFFDQEYDDAIGNYSDAIRPINNIQVEKMNLRDFVTLIRNKLKIGLCFEKISSYEEALTFYSDSTKDVGRYIYYHHNNRTTLSAGNEQKSQLNEMYLSSSLSDLLQIIVQCFLAKIYTQEKMGLEGISTPKVRIALGDFLKITDMISNICGRNNLIIANSFLHLGKLVYFKNSSVASPDESVLHKDRLAAYPNWIRGRLSILKKANKKVKKNVEQIIKRQPILAYNIYLIGLDEVMRSRNKMSAGKKLDELLYNNKNLNLFASYYPVLEKHLTSADESYTANHYKYIAGFLSNIGDCLLGTYNLKVSNPADFSAKSISSKNYKQLKIEELFNFKSVKKGNRFLSKLHASNAEFFSVADALRCYYISALYFEKYGRISSASFQYRKILHVLRLVLSSKWNSQAKKFIQFIKKTVVQKALNIASMSSGRTDKHMINKAAEGTCGIDDNFIQNNISNHPDVREILLLFRYIKLKLGYEQKSINDFINSHYSLATQYLRLMELDYYSKYLFGRLSPLFSTMIKFKEKENKDRLIAYLFSMHSIIQILKIYGTDYMVSHSFVAYSHLRIAEFLYNIDNIKLEMEEITKDSFKKLFGKTSLVLWDKNYHYSMAKDHFEKAIQLHTAGVEYKKTVKDMIYLEDDFNDNAYHFGAALDRYIMVKEVFKENIKLCNHRIKL